MTVHLSGDASVLAAMFDRAGVVYDVRTEVKQPGEPDAAIQFTVPSGDEPHNTGYSSFWAEFIFDGDGNLVSVGAWE